MKTTNTSPVSFFTRYLSSRLLPALILAGVASAAPVDRIRFHEVFEDIDCGLYQGRRYCTQQDTTGRASLTGFVYWGDAVDISLFNFNTCFGVGIGVFGYSGTLREDLSYRPGKRYAVMPIYYLNFNDQLVRSGTLVLRWTEKGFWFWLSGPTDSYFSAMSPAIAPGFYNSVPGPVSTTAEIGVFVDVGCSNQSWEWEKTIPVEISGEVIHRTIRDAEKELMTTRVVLNGRICSTGCAGEAEP